MGTRSILREKCKKQKIVYFKSSAIAELFLFLIFTIKNTIYE